MIHCSFGWKDIGSLEDLKATELEPADSGRQIAYRCENTEIINQGGRSTVVANGLNDILIVNTQDAVYVGKKGESDALKNIVQENPQMRTFLESGRIVYRAWGSYSRTYHISFFPYSLSFSKAYSSSGCT
mgnify:CR=1 FL=1